MNYLWTLCLLITIIVKTSHCKMFISSSNKWVNTYQNQLYKSLKKVRNKIEECNRKKINKINMTLYLILSHFQFNVKKKIKNSNNTEKT